MGYLQKRKRRPEKYFGPPKTNNEDIELCKVVKEAPKNQYLGKVCNLKFLG